MTLLCHISYYHVIKLHTFTAFATFLLPNQDSRDLNASLLYVVNCSSVNYELKFYQIIV